MGMMRVFFFSLLQLTNNFTRQKYSRMNCNKHYVCGKLSLLLRKNRCIDLFLLCAESSYRMPHKNPLITCKKRVNQGNSTPDHSVSVPFCFWRKSLNGRNGKIMLLLILKGTQEQLLQLQVGVKRKCMCLSQLVCVSKFSH